MRKRKVKKRTRLIALLSALATLAVGGIGTGLAFSAMAATRGGATVSSATLHRKIRVIDPAKDSEGAVLSSSPNPCKTTYTPANRYGTCTSPETYSAFNSSAYVNQLVVTGQIYGGWAGEQFNASVDLGAGTAMPIAGVEGLWNGSNFVNPNTLTPSELEEAMLEGGYMGGIMASAVWSGEAYPFLGGVEYNGQLNSAMVTNGAGTISGSLYGTGYQSAPESLQYIFQNDCNNSELLYNPFFSSMASEPTPQLEATVAGLIFGKAAAEGFAKTGKLPQTPQDYYNDYASVQVQVDGKKVKVNEMGGLYGEYLASYDKVSSPTVTDDLNSMYSTGLQLVSDVPTFQTGMKDYTSAAGNLISALQTAQNEYYQLWSELEADGHGGNFGITQSKVNEAKEAYEKAIAALNPAKNAYLKAVGTASTSTQPLLCLAAWNYNVGYTSFPTEEDFYGQGSISPASPSGSARAPKAYWGIGPAYEGSSNAADGTLAMDVSPTATNFLYTVLGGDSNATVYGNSGVLLMAFYNTNQTSGSYSQNGASVTVNVKPVESSSGTISANGTWLQISFSSLGQTPTEVNPTSLPSGVTLSTSSPSSDGLYFKALSQSGEPLKSVTMELVPEGGNYYGYWGGGSTPLHPMTNGAAATAGIWPNIGQKTSYWAGYNASPWPGAAPYKASAWSGYGWAQFSANSVLNSSGQPTGWFDFSGVGAGTYNVVILSGTTESGKTVSYGSYYDVPTFQIDANHGYSSPETISAVSDPCGFVDPAQDEGVVGASNPSSSIPQGAASPKSGTNDPYTATVGSKNPFTYQAEAYMPFDLSGEKNNSGASSSSAPLAFTLSLPEGETLNQGSVEVDGKSLSTLGVTPSSSSAGISFSLSPADIASIGSQGGTVDVTFTAYLNPSFTSSASAKYEFAYKAYGTANSGDSQEDLAAVSTNGPAGQDYSKVSLDPASSPSSETGLWFKDLQADGAESTGAKFEVQNSSGQYLNGDPSNFSGWTWSSTPQQFSASSLGTGTFAFGGLQDGTYFVTLTQWPEEMMKGTEGNGANTGKNNWASAPYPMGVATGSAATDSFQVVLSYSSPEDTTSINDPAGLVDHSSDSMYSLAPVKMAPVNGSSLSSQAYQTETVGVPFTEGWEGYLPFDSVNPYSSTLSSGIQVAFPEGDGGLNNGGNSSGLQMDSPATSNVEVAGIPLSQLISKGGLPSSDVTSSGGIYTIEIPGSVLSYIENNGKNEAGEPLSSSSNRLVIISFPALMTTSFKEGGQFQQWMALGADDGWWIQNPGGAWGVYSSPLYTNGPADNSVPSSLSPSQNSSNTGIWFKSLWYGTSTPATGSKYTVQNSSGKYLTPVESDGTFEGWSWSTSPYDFSEQNSSAVFSFGGLSDGAYTLTQVDPAKGATPSSLTFTSTLSYPSPQSLKAVKDSLNLLDSSKDTVWAMVVPSSLPFTGGKMILLVSLSAVVLFGAGAIFFILRKRRRA